MGGHNAGGGKVWGGQQLSRENHLLFFVFFIIWEGRKEDLSWSENQNEKKIHTHAAGIDGGNRCQ